MKTENEIYNSYVEYHNRIAPGVPPLSFGQWSTPAIYNEEIKRHQADKFLDSLHPNGGNLAGFKGVVDTEQADEA